MFHLVAIDSVGRKLSGTGRSAFPVILLLTMTSTETATIYDITKRRWKETVTLTQFTILQILNYIRRDQYNNKKLKIHNETTLKQYLLSANSEQDRR